MENFEQEIVCCRTRRVNYLFISTLQHAADMGIELHKAEMSLKHGFEYVQDKSLNIDKGKKFK